MSDTVTRWAQIRSAIAQAARDVERDPDSVALIAVSKTMPAEAILPVLEAGQRLFGENYVQEAKAKWPALKERFPDAELHMIGPLQSNKAREAVELFDVIQSLDRPKLAASLAGAMSRLQRRPDCYIQVNTGGEPQKAGIAPALFADFLRECRDHHGLPVVGLMCIPPLEQPPEPHFAQLRDLARRYGLARLSMGMSGDFEAAIARGATDVRVGTAIFGQRVSAPAKV